MTRTPDGARDVVGLARQLRSLSPGKWTEADLRAMADRQGWEWADDEWGPRLRTGEGFGVYSPP